MERIEQSLPRHNLIFYGSSGPELKGKDDEICQTSKLGRHRLRFDRDDLDLLP